MMTKDEILMGGKYSNRAQDWTTVTTNYLCKIQEQAILAIELAEKLEKYEPTLKPCPFCGGEGFVWDWNEDGNTYWQAECNCCECVVGERHKTMELAVEKWNKRVGE